MWCRRLRVGRLNDSWLADALAAQRRRAWRARTHVVARARSALAPQRRRGPQASPLLDATGSLSARSRPVRRSRGAARAEMVAMAQAGSPPGDGLPARRRHRWLSASAPDSGNATHPAVKLQLCALCCRTVHNCSQIARSTWFEAAGPSPTLHSSLFSCNTAHSL